MNLLLFDIDGTLLLTGGAGLAAFRDALSAAGLPSERIETIRFDGMTDPAIVRQLLAPQGLDRPELIQTVLDAYLEHFRRRLPRARSFRVLPGVSEGLAALSRRADCRLGLATGNLEPAAWLKLRHAGLDGYFEFGGFGSDAEERAELVARAIQRGRKRCGDGAARAVVIGDTPRDIAAARRAGALAVGVASGRFSLAELAAAGAHRAIPDLAPPHPWLDECLTLAG
jgi:phosphoglycolate phosphatase-like HAD superfamily hydrolase